MAKNKPKPNQRSNTMTTTGFVQKEDNVDTKDTVDTTTETKTEVDTTTEKTVVDAPKVEEKETAPVVPETLFAKTTAEDSTRVKIILAQIDRLTTDAINTQVDEAKVQLAVRGFHTAIRTLTTAAASEIPKLVDHILNAIRKDTKDTFKIYVYKYHERINSQIEHDCYMRLINLFKLAAKYQNPARVHQEVDVLFSIKLVSNAEAYKALLNYFSE